MKYERSPYTSKYYVWSGRFKRLVINESPILAALDCYEAFKDTHEFDDRFIYVSTRGFRTLSAESKIAIADLIDLMWECEPDDEVETDEP